MIPASGADVLKWPEFLAFAKRLCIDLKPSTTGLAILIPADGLVQIAQDTRGVARDYLGKDRRLMENRRASNYGMWRTAKPEAPDGPRESST